MAAHTGVYPRGAAARGAGAAHGWRTEGARPVLYTVFTCPPALRLRAADPTWWGRVRRRIWRVLEQEVGGWYAVERTDPAGQCETSRVSGEYCDCARCSTWHPHLKLLWVQRPGFRPFVDVSKLRRRWMEVLGEEELRARGYRKLRRRQGVWRRRSDGSERRPLDLFADAVGGVQEVQIHHAYAPFVGRHRSADECGCYSCSEKRVGHWCSYVGRTWPAWIRAVPRHLTVRWMGDYPRRVEPPRKVCEQCGRECRLLEFGCLEEAERFALLGPERCAEEWEWRIVDRLRRKG